MNIAYGTNTEFNRARFDVWVPIPPNIADPARPVPVGPGTPVWASVTEIDGGGNPFNGGAHVTVDQVVAGSGGATVRVWVDNVPVNINVKVTAFADYG